MCALCLIQTNKTQKDLFYCTNFYWKTYRKKKDTFLRTQTDHSKWALGGWSNSVCTLVFLISWSKNIHFFFFLRYINVWIHKTTHNHYTTRRIWVSNKNLNVKKKKKSYVCAHKLSSLKRMSVVHFPWLDWSSASMSRYQRAPSCLTEGLLQVIPICFSIKDRKKK